MPELNDLATVLLMCVECEDTKACVECVDCSDMYCELCFQAQHLKGTRKKHRRERMQKKQEESESSSSRLIRPVRETAQQIEEQTEAAAGIRVSDIDIVTSVDSTDSAARDPGQPCLDSHYIPVRLSHEERQYFVLLDACLRVSEYTDNVDILCYRSSTSKRVLKELRELFSLMSGMVLANNFHKGRRLIQGRDFMANEEFLQTIFEVGRRYKVMNPERMRDNYGKMIHVLQDSCGKEIKRHLQFSCIKPIKTVHSTLEDKNALEMLNDPLFRVATGAIGADRCATTTTTTTSSSSSSSSTTNSSSSLREELETRTKQKALAIQTLCQTYASDVLSATEIHDCLASVADSNSYVVQNCGPIKAMMQLLQTHFDPQAPESKVLSLALSAGRHGARLTHSHSTQYYYVLQSLHLWHHITENMLSLWFAAEADLLSGHGYRLRDTGQGLNRLQRAPQTSKRIHKILSEAQGMTDQSWIGSSVIHLGDHNVCNALAFIDKYCCVSRILNPIVQTIAEIDSLSADVHIGAFIEQTFGGPEALRKQILCDFFKHGFDGSGADNFFDAGSCIDGRLTSAWNWCSKIEKKPFYHVFLLAGFVGFDGSFET